MKESAEIWNDAAKSLEFQQNFQGAASCYERARKMGDESAETLLNLAVSYLQLYEFYKQDKYLESAKGFLLSGIEKEEQNPKLHHYLGLVYLASGDKEMATREFLCEEERRAEEGSELLLRFDLPLESPAVYESAKSDVYELFPDPALYKIFDLVKEFPMDSSLFASLKDTYGDRDSASLLALYLRSIYFKVFEDRDFAAQLGLSSSQSKWEALLLFFVRGINAESKSLVKNSLREGRLDLFGLPVYTRLLVGRYRREILSTAYNKESFKALILLPLRKLESLDAACEDARQAKEGGEGKQRAETILKTLAKAGLAHKKGESFMLSEPVLKGFEDAERIRAKISKAQFDSEFFILLHALLRGKRFEYALALAKKIRALYEENEATAYMKDILSSLSLSEDEKFEIISEA